jgi:alkylated DNA repair dioxygenase AlkB
MYEKEVEVNRYSKSYLNTWTDLDHTSTRSYMYSGFDTSTNNDPLPENFVDYYKWIKEQDPRYNQVIANWYENKFDYIAPHSDCVKGMIPGAKISIMSFYSNINPNNFRFMELRPKVKTETLVEVFKIRLDHGTIITMCGKTQELFVHGIPKSESDVCERISLSFRQMADK